jgi:hypothetical protein
LSCLLFKNTTFRRLDSACETSCFKLKNRTMDNVHNFESPKRRVFKKKTERWIMPNIAIDGGRGYLEDAFSTPKVISTVSFVVWAMPTSNNIISLMIWKFKRNTSVSVAC